MHGGAAVCLPPSPPAVDLCPLLKKKTKEKKIENHISEQSALENMLSEDKPFLATYLLIF